MCYKNGHEFYADTMKLRGADGSAAVIRYLLMQKTEVYYNDPAEKQFCLEAENDLRADCRRKKGTDTFRIDITDGWRTDAPLLLRLHIPFNSREEADAFVRGIIYQTIYGGYVNRVRI